jgi:hypothetical protein
LFTVLILKRIVQSRAKRNTSYLGIIRKKIDFHGLEEVVRSENSTRTTTSTVTLALHKELPSFEEALRRYCSVNGFGAV